MTNFFSVLLSFGDYRIRKSVTCAFMDQRTFMVNAETTFCTRLCSIPHTSLFGSRSQLLVRYYQSPVDSILTVDFFTILVLEVLIISFTVSYFSISLVFIALYCNHSLVKLAMDDWSIEWSYLFLVLPCGYTPWSCWSDCDASCGDKIQSRERSCTNPPPSLPGFDCSGLGPAIEVRQCYGPPNQIGMWTWVWLSGGQQ